MSVPLRTLQRAAVGPSEHSTLNDSGDLWALRTACGTFGMVCVSVFFVACVVQLSVALLRLYTRPETAVEKGSDTKPHSTVRHLGIIMDGNRRFGKRQSTSRKEPDPAVLEALRAELCSPEAVQVFSGDEGNSSWLVTRYNHFMKLIKHTAFDGHRTGGEKLLEVLSYCMEANVDMVTAYAFSTDNWQRSAAEVDALMSLFFFFFDRIRTMALEQHIFVRFISTEPERLPPRVLELMRKVEVASRAVTPRRLTVNICVSYSGQSEIVAACNRILSRRLRDGGPSFAAPVTRAEMSSEMLRSITQDDYEEQDKVIFSNGVSAEPELILRTSGEQRVSNFLLYECAYSEFAFFKKTWPELTRDDFMAVLDDYARRDKRKGK
jgi:undecaprenyl diphosphate synthase